MSCRHLTLSSDQHTQIYALTQPPPPRPMIHCIINESGVSIYDFFLSSILKFSKNQFSI